MSLSVAITITPKPDGFIPNESILVDLLNNVADGVLENAESWQKPELFVGGDGSSSWSVGASSKWAIEGVDTFAILVSENYPVQVEVERSSYAEDEPEQSTSVFVDGKLTEYSELELMPARVVGGIVTPLDEAEWARAHEIAADPCGHDDDEVTQLIKLLIFLAGGPTQ